MFLLLQVRENPEKKMMKASSRISIINLDNCSKILTSFDLTCWLVVYGVPKIRLRNRSDHGSSQISMFDFASTPD